MKTEKVPLSPTDAWDLRDAMASEESARARVASILRRILPDEPTGREEIKVEADGVYLVVPGEPTDSTPPSKKAVKK